MQSLKYLRSFMAHCLHKILVYFIWQVELTIHSPSAARKTPPNRLVVPEISITIPHGEENRRYPTPALLPALGVESHVIVWFPMAKPSFPRLNLPPRLRQSPGGVNGAASEFAGRNCTSCTLLELSWPLMGNSRVGATPTFLLNVCQAPLNQLRYFSHSQEASQIVLWGK